MTCESNSAKFLDQMNTAFPYMIPDQDMLIGSRGFGACCDPAFADVPSALLAERFTSVRLALRLVTAPEPGAVAGDFVLDQTRMPQFFAAGQRESAEALTNIWEPQTYAQNNCYPGGAPVDINQSFLCFGHAFEFVGLGSRAWLGAANAPGDLWLQTVFSSKGQGGTYEQRAFKAIAGRVFAFANFGNTTINYLLGTLVDAPAMAGPYGADAISAGQPIVGAYKPYKAAFLINARDQSRKLTVSLNSISGSGAGGVTPVNVQGDNANPAPAPTPTVTDGQLYMEFKMRMFGVPLCWSPDTNCNVPSGPIDANNPAVMQLVRTMVAAELARSK
jgi:hypothetical protein